MLTLYAPVGGIVTPAAGGASGRQGVGIAAPADAPGVVLAPTRGTVVQTGPACVRLRDLRGREALVALRAPAPVALLVAEGDEIGFDAPLLRWEAARWASVICEVTVPDGSDLLLHAEVGDAVEAGADLFSVGPFACGVSGPRDPGLDLIAP